MNTTKAAPLAGVLGIAGVIAGLAMDNFPDGSMDDAAVARWFDSHGTGLWMASGFAIALGGTACCSLFAARDRRAGRGAPGPARSPGTSPAPRPPPGACSP